MTAARTLLAFVVVAIADDRVTLNVNVGDGWRPVSVLRHGTDTRPVWGSMEFPHALNDAGETLGSAELDDLARLKAFEALVIVDATARAMAAA